MCSLKRIRTVVILTELKAKREIKGTRRKASTLAFPFFPVYFLSKLLFIILTFEDSH